MVGVLVSFLFQFLFPLSLLDVGLDVEVGKENEKHRAMEQNHVAEYLREITLDEEWKAGVNEEGHELSHLQLGQVSGTSQFTIIRTRDGGIMSIKASYVIT